MRQWQTDASPERALDAEAHRAALAAAGIDGPVVEAHGLYSGL
jgi:hypothetical protein